MRDRTNEQPRYHPRGSGRRSTPWVLLLTAGLLTACSGAPEVPGSSSPAGVSSTAPASVEPSAEPTPTSTLTAAQERAVAAATKTVVAYRQTIIDLLSGTRTSLNDLNEVATGKLLDRDLRGLQASLGQGWKAVPGGEVSAPWARPIDVDLQRNPPRVRLRVCIDLSRIRFTDPKGDVEAGDRAYADYIVLMGRSGVAGGWLVADALAQEGSRSC